MPYHALQYPSNDETYHILIYNIFPGVRSPLVIRHTVPLTTVTPFNDDTIRITPNSFSNVHHLQNSSALQKDSRCIFVNFHVSRWFWICFLFFLCDCRSVELVVVDRWSSRATYSLNVKIFLFDFYHFYFYIVPKNNIGAVEPNTGAVEPIDRLHTNIGAVEPI